MRKTIFKSTFILAALAAVVMISCGPSLKNIKEKPLDDDLSTLSEKESKLNKDELKKWPEMDMHTDTVPGMSITKAYEEIIKDHKGETVVVGIVDAGVDINHEDLKEVIWTNKKEVADNGKDDDGNGYIDDVHGWNFLGDAVHENLEYTRLLKDLKPKYDDQSENDIKEEDQEDYELYKRASKEYDKEYKEAKQNKQQYEQIKTHVENALAILKENTGKDSLTANDIANINADDTEVSQAKQMMTNIFQQSGAESSKQITSELNEAYDHFNSKLEYHLNLDFDGREIVGDDADDISDTDYGNNDVTGPSEDKEDILHGTHVAGIVGAVRDNDIGMNGVANNVEILPVRAVPDGDEYDKDIALGIRYAVDNGAKIINMSFGKYFSPHSEWVIDALKYAEEHDVLMVNAAGNESYNLDEKRSYPNDEWPGQEEIVDNVITVGALNYEYGAGLIAPFSNYGKSSVDVFAPGSQIWATAPLDEYKFLQGTSMAAPGVAGIAAVIRSYFPKLSAAAVKKVIMDSGLTSDKKVILGGDSDNKKPFSEISKSGKMANLYNALIMASKM